MPRPDPNASDWSDLDLLTIGEATERLDDEISAIRARLDGLTGSVESEADRQRLELLIRARARAASGPKRPLHG